MINTRPGIKHLIRLHFMLRAVRSKIKTEKVNDRFCDQQTLLETELFLVDEIQELEEQLFPGQAKIAASHGDYLFARHPAGKELTAS